MMATGPNYSHAKQLLGMAHHWSYGDGGDATVGSALATEALAHAVLALVDVLTEAQTKQAAHNADDANADTEAYLQAYVDVADAERYAQRDEYVNSERTTLAEQLRAHGAEQQAQDAENDAFHAQRRADEAEANGEYVDYAEAEAVREIREEMALEAAGVESWDQL